MAGSGTCACTVAQRPVVGAHTGHFEAEPVTQFVDVTANLFRFVPDHHNELFTPTLAQVRIALSIRDWPNNCVSGLGTFESMRAPWPAAKMTAGRCSVCVDKCFVIQVPSRDSIGKLPSRCFDQREPRRPVTGERKGLYQEDSAGYQPLPHRESRGEEALNWQSIACVPSML